MTGIGKMKKLTIGMLMVLGLSACSTSGSLSVAKKTVNYELSPVVYEKHVPVIYPAGSRGEL